MAVWRELAAAMGFGARVDQSRSPAGLHPTRSATLSLGRDVDRRGRRGASRRARCFGVTERVAVLELDLTVLLGQRRRRCRCGSRRAASRPATSIWRSSTPDSVTAEKVEKAIRQAAGSLLVDLALFDVYRGAGVPAGSRSLAYRLRLQAPDRTLTDAELTEVRNKVIVGVAKLGATIRG